MPQITADKVVNRNLYAKSRVYGYDGTFQNVTTIYTPGQLIGNVYSYIQQPDGLYWMVYKTTADYNGMRPTYIKHDQSKLSLPDLPEILETISREQEKQKMQEKGVLQYNIDKYLPYVIGAVVVAVALPTLTNAIKKK